MSNLFEAAYNPDVLSCLANLSNDEVFTPPEIANQILDLLPKELWSDPNARFLDPACKSGVFLREIAKRLIAGLEETYPDLDERLEHIFKKQLFGIAITELTSLLSRRSLYCSKFPTSKYSVVRFDEAEGNVRFRNSEHSWYAGRCKYCGATQKEYERDSSLEQHAYEFIHLDQPKEVFEMKFDVVIGNPPYQMSTGGSKAQATPIYNKFIDQAKKLNPRYLLMIIPDRWFAGGFGLNDFRKSMLTDDRIEAIYDYPLASDCFPGVDIPGGICYFLWSRDRHGDCEVTVNSNGKTTTMRRPLLEPGCDVFVKYNEAIPILHKVQAKKERLFIDSVSSQKPFGLGTQFVGESTQTKGSVAVFGRNQTVSYVSENSLTSPNEMVWRWKVFISASYGERIPENLYVLGKPFLGEPGTACTETYIMIGPVNSRAEAENLRTYIATKFFRFLVMIKKPTQHTLKNVYGFVPVQDYSHPWTDEMLYKKYGLTDDEIAFIETMIRPMDLGEN